MYSSKTIKMDQITLQDLLTADTHSYVIKIQDDIFQKAHDLIPSRELFFAQNGLFSKVKRNGIIIMQGGNETSTDLCKFLNDIDNCQQSCIVLLEGFAGCGKSTLVQYILCNQLKTYNYNYNFFNYDLEAQNDLITRDKNRNIIRRSSIFEAIKKSFVQQFVFLSQSYTKIIDDFKEAICKCKEFQPFNDLYYRFINTNTFDEILTYVKEDAKKHQNVIESNLMIQLEQIDSKMCLLSLDYLLRISMYKNKKIEKLYICYDNLDAIEDADDLKDFDKKLVEFRDLLEDIIIILQNYDFFNDLAKPHFIIMATYRKITAKMARISEYSAYREVKIDEASGSDKKEFIYHIDVTSAFSYKNIVEKRKNYFINYLNNAQNITRSRKQMLKMNFTSWNNINQKLEIMDDRYACLWNKNYRTCSIIANKLYSTTSYGFCNNTSVIEDSKMPDGYGSDESIKGDDILCSYYGGSAILLSCICKVFHDNKIWDDFLMLTPLNTTSSSYDNVSFSRIILTYMYNVNRVVSLKELYDEFCKKGLFSYQLLCEILSKMLARNLDGVWRRPIYYANDFILSEDAKEIENNFLDECSYLCENGRTARNFEFLLCDSGKSYVERLMQEFEFFSNRLSNSNPPLYLCKDIKDMKLIINDVRNAVENCCNNMLKFKDKYIELYGISQEEYMSLKIHPITNNNKSPQLHTERVIFSHVSYLNNVRLFFIDDKINRDMNKKKEYNKIFVYAINDYLNIYFNLIKPLTSARQFIANGLKEIVDKIIIEIENDSNKIDILFQPISLKFSDNRDN